MKRGDVVIVAPAGEFGKPRPAVVIQSDQALPASIITYLPITSDLLRVPDVRIAIHPTSENGLTKSSEIMVDMIQTSSLRRFGNVIGKVDAVTLKLIEAALSVHLGLANASDDFD